LIIYRGTIEKDDGGEMVISEGDDEDEKSTTKSDKPAKERVMVKGKRKAATTKA